MPRYPPLYIIPATTAGVVGRVVSVETRLFVYVSIWGASIWRRNAVGIMRKKIPTPPTPQRKRFDVATIRGSAWNAARCYLVNWKGLTS